MGASIGCGAPEKSSASNTFGRSARVSAPARCELLLEATQGALVPLEELHLELAKAPCHALAVEHRNRIVDDLRAACAHTLTARPEARHGHGRATAQEGHQQTGQLLGWPRRRPGRLELDPCGTVRELQLPEPRAVLDPVPEGDAVPGEHEVRGVVVRGDEDARRQRLTAQLRHHEIGRRDELQLVLDGLLHRRPGRYSACAVFTDVSFGLTCAARAPVAHAEDVRVLRALRPTPAENALEVARLVERRFREHPNSGVTQEQVKAAETDGDGLTRELIQLLNTQYLTPVRPRGHLHARDEIDDVVDELEEASDLLGLYGIELPTKHAVQQMRDQHEAAEQLAVACDNLKSLRGVQAAARRAEAARGRRRPRPPRGARRALPRRPASIR